MPDRTNPSPGPSRNPSPERGGENEGGRFSPPSLSGKGAGGLGSPRAADVLLTILLRLVGGVELCAIPFIFFPFPWMDFVHDRLLGLGSLPDRPIVEYLTRSLSALYAVHGAMVLRISFDIDRYRPLVRFLGALHILLGLTILGIDITANLPWWWIAVEGPGIVVGGILVVLLERAGRMAEA